MLTTSAWGCTATGSTPSSCVSGGVSSRGTPATGSRGSTNPPAYYYWDGSVVRAADGTYHLFADRWPGSSGFNPGWLSSDPVHASGGTSAFGPYTDKGYAYSNGSFGSDPHHGHNSQVVTLLNGTYALIVSEVVPFTIFTASSLDGPWTPCSGSPGSGLSVPSAFGGNTSYASNVSLVVRPDGDFEIIQRHGLIALSTSGICGPYKAQQPTNTYPSSEAIPSQYGASIFPNKAKHADPMGPSNVEATYIYAEDPVIWFSGGQYHVLYDYPDDRVGYLLSSADGIHDWTDQGLAYDPRYAQQIFSYTDGTVDHWNKMERPGVVVVDGHIAYVTFAVSDVDKNNQISANSNHGSKVIVVPFDGVAFDADNGAGGRGGRRRWGRGRCRSSRKPRHRRRGRWRRGRSLGGNRRGSRVVGKGRERWRRVGDGRCRRKLQRRSRRVWHWWFDRDRRRSGHGRERHRWDHSRCGGRLGPWWHPGHRHGRGFSDRLGRWGRSGEVAPPARARQRAAAHALWPTPGQAPIVGAMSGSWWASRWPSSSRDGLAGLDVP